MAAQRSGPFSRRCGDRNRSWTRNNEEGKSRRRDRMTIDSKDSRVFFRKRIPPGKQSGKQRGGSATVRRKWNQEEEADGETRGKQEGQEKARISITESDVSSLKQDRRERRTLEYRPNLIPVGSRANPSTIQPSYLEPSWRRGIPDFPPVSEKGDDGSVCDSGICRRSNLRGRRIARRCDRTVETTIDSFAGRDRIYSRI